MYSKVSILTSNEETKEKLKQVNAFKNMEQYLKDEVQARQQVNAELGNYGLRCLSLTNTP